GRPLISSALRAAGASGAASERSEREERRAHVRQADVRRHGAGRPRRPAHGDGPRPPPQHRRARIRQEPRDRRRQRPLRRQAHSAPACRVKGALEGERGVKAGKLPGVSAVAVKMTANTTGRQFQDKVVLPGVKNAIAVASGKGGVGKSTTAVNLALALAERGARVGLMDADVYGPSIPMMLGVQKRPKMTPEKKILPIEAHRPAAMPMGYLSDDNTPVIWRGPMVSGLISQFLGVVEWGELDYLVIDLPPGTGDIQLTLCQQAPLAGAVIVTTPQDVSLLDARKGLKMFEQVNVPVLGIVENMSYFVCGHCHERTDIFRHGGGQSEAVRLGVPFLGEIPLDPDVVVGGDEGQPILLRNPQSPVSEAYRKVAGAMAAQLSIANAAAPAQSNVKFMWD